MIVLVLTVCNNETDKNTGEATNDTADNSVKEESGNNLFNPMNNRRRLLDRSKR